MQNTSSQVTQQKTFKSLGYGREERVPVFGLYNVYYKIGGRLVPIYEAPRAQKL